MGNNSVNSYVNRGFSLAEKSVNQYDKALIEAYRASLKEIKLSLSRIYELYGDEVSFSKMQERNRLRNLQTQIQSEIKKLSGKAGKTIKTAIIDSYSTTYYYTAFSLESTLEISLGFGLLNTSKIEAIIRNPLEHLNWQQALTKAHSNLTYELNQTLTQGFIRGHGYARTAKEVTGRFSVAHSKAKRIVWTETHRSSNEGFNHSIKKAFSSAEKLGLEIRKIWISTLDSRTRTDHRLMDGRLSDQEGLFILPGGIRTAGPGLSGIGSQDIHCRCTQGIHIEGLEEGKRRDNITKKDIKYTSYSEWARSKGL